MTGFSIGEFPLVLRRHPRARHLKLRFDPRSGSALLTLPPGVSEHKALQFAEKHHDWIREQQRKSPLTIPLAPQMDIPFHGAAHRIIHAPDSPAAVRRTEGFFHVGGSREGFETRLQNWLRRQAREELTRAVEDFTPHIPRRPERITIRDTKSRWGSCSTRRSLSFSWRLVMAPPAVLRYVVAHEMAHLMEMNHSPAFWALVGALDPGWRKSRRWLKSEGGRLMLIG